MIGLNQPGAASSGFEVFKKEVQIEGSSPEGSIPDFTGEKNVKSGRMKYCDPGFADRDNYADSSMN